MQLPFALRVYRPARPAGIRAGLVPSINDGVDGPLGGVDAPYLALVSRKSEGTVHGKDWHDRVGFGEVQFSSSLGG